jgi:hypothetical protein
MPTTLRDPTVRLLDLPSQPLGPLPQKDAPDDTRGSTIYTDRGRGVFRRHRRTVEAHSVQ